MSFAPHIWNQLKNLTADELIAALRKDGWEKDETSGAVQAFRKGTARVTIHYHPGKTYGPGLLKALLADIGWNEKDLRRLKLIK